MFETVGDPWGIGGDYHEYAFGSKFDRDGNIWVVLCLTGSFNSDIRFRGWCLKLAADGKWTPVCAGVRSPGGIGFNAAGDVFYTDNQGPWNGACKLQWLKPGAFVGHPGGLPWFDETVSLEQGKEDREQPRESRRDRRRRAEEARGAEERLRGSRTRRSAFPSCCRRRSIFRTTRWASRRRASCAI